MVVNLRASFLISILLPLAVLMVFIAMRYVGVEANIVALSGIAIAIGTIVDVGIILTENIIKHLDDDANKSQSLFDKIYNASTEIAPAILTAVLTTIISFIPVFSLEAAEGKLFIPLAFTKTFALVAAIIITIIILPAMAYLVFGIKSKTAKMRHLAYALIALVGIYALFQQMIWAAVILMLFALVHFLQTFIKRENWLLNHAQFIISVIAAAWLLASEWLPLGAEQSVFINFVFVVLVSGSLLAFFQLIIYYYQQILSWCLENKALFLSIPTFLVMIGLCIWLGFASVFSFVAKGTDAIGWNIRKTDVWSGLTHTFPGMGKEFMPALDEGSFLLMPTNMVHAGLEENHRVLRMLDVAVESIPEVEEVVGKLGRVESALDPAPISMYENVINYKSEYLTDKKGKKTRFKTNTKGHFELSDGSSYDPAQNEPHLVNTGLLIPDSKGKYFRQWRKEIRSADDIWNEISQVTKLPGVTSAPKLQPIETRLVMLQSGMRAPMGIKVKGPDLPSIGDFALQLEKALQEVPGVKKEAVFAERVEGKPYLLINPDRLALARYGISIDDFQEMLMALMGGMEVTQTVEGRERFQVRLRYPRELRNSPEDISNLLITTAKGAQIPLGQLAEIGYEKGPQMIKSEDTFLTAYVLFDRKSDLAEGTVVDNAQQYIKEQIKAGKLKVPAGVSYEFAGSYENQIRAEKRLGFIIPIVLVVILLILYFQFKSLLTSMMVFTGIAVAFSGGFIMLFAYNQEWFFNFTLFGINWRDVFQIHDTNLSVAVWVGFIALFGIATDDGVVMASYLDQSFAKNPTTDIKQIRAAVVEAGMKRIRPCLMTTATTLLALLPILTSAGRGSDIMIPMAIPAFGGMSIALITIFIVPVLYAMREEFKIKKQKS